MTNKNYVLTDGMYYVKYNPLPDSVQWKGKPFVVISDMFVHKKIRVASWQGFWKVAQENPRARLIQKFTNISAEVFGLAKTHPGLQVPVCLDFVKYEKFLKENNPDLDYLHVFREVLEDDD